MNLLGIGNTNVAADGESRANGDDSQPSAPDGQGGGRQPGTLQISGSLRITGDGVGIFDNTRGVVAPR